VRIVGKSKHTRLLIEAARALERRHPDAGFVEPVERVYMSIWAKECGQKKTDRRGEHVQDEGKQK
jgi:hypothetical protein